MKLIKKLGIIIVILCSIVVVLGIILYVSPSTTNLLTRTAFAQGDAYPRHPQYEEAIKQVQVEKDVAYDSLELTVVDFYYPSDTTKTYPLLLWVHGGAFVGGDKKDCEGFLTMLASEGYVVANVNYELTPEIAYPQPIRNLQACSTFIQTQMQSYPIDDTRIFIGGDSAGANLAGQFVNIQMNETYAALLGIQPSWQPDQIKGYLSFCGLLDLPTYDETDSWLSNFVFKQSAISYFKDFSWKRSEQVKQANFIDHITTFPPVYITDGSQNSFLPQAKAAIQKLQAQQIEVTSLFFDEQPLAHEYQFLLDTKEALANYNSVTAFLSAHS